MPVITSALHDLREESINQMLWRLWRNRILVILAAVTADVIATNVALLLIYWFIRPLNIEGQAQFDNTPISAVWFFVALMNAVFFVTYEVSGMYRLPRGMSRIDESFKTVATVTTSVGIVYLLNLVIPQFGLINVPIVTSTLLGGWGVLLVMTVLLRFIYRTNLANIRRRNIDVRRVLIIGALEPGQLVYRSLMRDLSLGYRVVGFVR